MSRSFFILVFSLITSFVMGGSVMAGEAFAANASVSIKPIKIAIANYGPHTTLEEAVKGFKQGMREGGYQEGVNITYVESHVNFDQTLIPQMLAQLKASKPDIILTISTPISLAAKHIVKDIPLVFTCITDPVAVGLVPSRDRGDANMTGSSDMPNADGILSFAKTIIPKAQAVGLLYSTAEANDTALKNSIDVAARERRMTLTAIGIDQSRDIPQRIQLLKGKADFIYVGTSGAVQPALPAIVSNANRLKIPVINADPDSVKQGLALGSFAVSYIQVGKNAAVIALEIIKGKAPATIAPIYPNIEDHQAYVSQKVAKIFDITIPISTNDIVVYP